MRHNGLRSALFSFTGEARYFAGQFYRAYFYFYGAMGRTPAESA